MTLQEVIDYARNGKIKNLSIDDDRLIGFINLGLLEIHKRLPLITKEETINLVEAKTNYDLVSKDILYIESAFDKMGKEYPINDERNYNSIFTPTFNTIQVPNPVKDEIVIIMYVAEPTKLINPTDEVNIPKSLLESLLLYIAYEAFESLNSEIQTENNTFYMRFENSIKKVKELSLVTQDDLGSNKFEIKGFA